MSDASRPSVTELATIDGLTYVAVPEGVQLPAQPAQVAATLQTVTPGQQLVEQISAHSTHVALIRERVIALIRSQYSIDDELKLLRTAPSEEFEIYNAFTEDARAWGRAERAKLGL